MTNRSGRFTDLLSFLIGTMILIIFYFTDSSAITEFGMIFIVVAGIINAGVFVKVFIDLINEKENRKKYFFTSGIMILNIPIVLAYFYFVMILMNTMRVSFINETGREITNLKIIGGEPKSIEKLEIGEKQTKWVAINSINDLILEYEFNGEVKTEMIYSYMVVGKKIEHRIGNKIKLIE